MEPTECPSKHSSTEEKVVTAVREKTVAQKSPAGFQQDPSLLRNRKGSCHKLLTTVTGPHAGYAKEPTQLR